MGPLKIEILVLVAALGAAGLALLDLAGIKLPTFRRGAADAPSTPSFRRYQLLSAAFVIVICLYSMHSEATTGKSLSAIAACSIFSSGKSCQPQENSSEGDPYRPEVQEPSQLNTTSSPASGPMTPSTFCNQINYTTDNPELDSMYTAAWNLDHGTDGRLDRVAARQLYRDAAERGHRASQYNLAVMLHRGQGGPVDNPSAVHWYKQAANQDDYLAVISLAGAYGDGWDGVGRDYARALEYNLIAERCEKGNITNNIGVLYALGGHGLQRDLTRAQMWFRKAEARGSRHAAQNLATIQDGFNPGPEKVWWDEVGPP